jgi:hypothetical protein
MVVHVNFSPGWSNATMLHSLQHAVPNGSKAASLNQLTILLPGEMKTSIHDELPNKSLDASGGSVFRIMTGPAMLD